MSRFDPSCVSPPHAPDHLASAVLEALSRPIGARQSWSVARMLILGVVSFGVLPVLILFWRWGEMIVGEQQQLLHLAKWIRQTTNHPQSAALESQAARMKPRAGLFVLIVLTVLATAGVMWAVIDDSARDFFDALLAGTFGYERKWLFDYRVRSFSNAQVIFAAWVVGLSAAYALHWLAVQLHAQDVKRFVWRFNQIVKDQGVHPAKPESLGIPLRPLWLAGAVCMAMLHAPWGVIAMLAGAAQRRYISSTSRNTRMDLAQRLRALMQHQSPEAHVPVPVYLRQRCLNPQCRTELPRGVNFCRRCGTPQKGQVDRVA